MRWKDYIDADEVRNAISVLQEPGTVFEVRAIGTAKKDIMSGYFRDADTLLQQLDHLDMRNRNVYITLGRVKDECFARAQSEDFLKSPQTTSDTEIIRYRWLFVDLDPVRPAGISSSDEELRAANTLSDQVFAYLQGLGFAEPVRAMSGNGYHLLYRIDVPNDKDGQALVEKCLKVLSAVFDSEKVKIDTTNSNPSRICKLHGTLAQKGRSTKERPHRMSKLLTVPDQIMITDKAVLKRLADDLPDQPAENRRQQNKQPEFDVRDFMRKHGMTYTEDSNSRSQIFRLDECPFDPNHRDGDAKVFLYPNGAIAFKCHHNSCRQYKWQDVRMRFEPDAYEKPDTSADDARIDAGYKKHVELREIERTINGEKKDKPKKARKAPRKLKTAEALIAKNLPEPRIYIGVGEELPLLVEGTCILSAKPKLGKSWLALSMCLAVARGEDFLGYQTRQCSTLYLDLETSEVLQQKRIKKALNGAKIPKNFYVEDETDKLNDGFVEQIEAYLQEDPHIGIVVIDVFQIIRTAASSAKESEYEHAYRDITPLNEIAQKYHISIILVCHDRKAVDPDDPFSNILGSTGLQGAATQMIVMFRQRKDDPIHISVKGKTIDGLPELNVELKNAKWSVVEAGKSEDAEKSRLLAEYRNSDIRRAVLEIANRNHWWKGRCGTLINDAVGYGISITETNKTIGGFLHRHQGRFLSEDDIQIQIIDNGTGPKIYKINKFTIDTIDENEEATIDEWQKADESGLSEIPFL